MLTAFFMSSLIFIDSYFRGAWEKNHTLLLAREMATHVKEPVNDSELFSLNVLPQKDHQNFETYDFHFEEGYLDYARPRGNQWVRVQVQIQKPLFMGMNKKSHAYLFQIMIAVTMFIVLFVMGRKENPFVFSVEKNVHFDSNKEIQMWNDSLKRVSKDLLIDIRNMLQMARNLSVSAVQARSKMLKMVGESRSTKNSFEDLNSHLRALSNHSDLEIDVENCIKSLEQLQQQLVPLTEHFGEVQKDFDRVVETGKNLSESVVESTESLSRQIEAINDWAS